MTSHRVPVSAIRDNAIIMIDDASDGLARCIEGALIVVRASDGLPSGADLRLADRLAENPNAVLVAEAIADAAIGEPDSLRAEDGVSMLVVGEDDRAHVIYFPSSQTEIDLLDEVEDLDQELEAA